MELNDLTEFLDSVRRRLQGASASPWTVDRDAQRHSFIRTGRREGESRLFVRRDLEPAGIEDVEFIALARNAAPRLVEALSNGDFDAVGLDELDRIEATAARATAGPWTPFIEETQPIGGCSVIWVGRESDPDMYLWLGDRIADGADVEFVAHSREDVPRLAAEIRSRKERPPGGR